MNAATRAALVAAVDGVTAGGFTVTGHAERPGSPRPGDAWPLWRGAERADGFVFEHTWALVVVVATTTTDADAMADVLGYALVDALEPVIFVDALLPVALATSAGDMNGLQITGRSE